MRQTLKRKLQKETLKGHIMLSQPPLVRLFHWGFAPSLIGVLISGFELHQPAPFLALQYGQIYIVHMVSAWLSLAFISIRATEAVLRKDTSTLAGLQDVKDFPKLLSYYLFLRSSPPPAAKYNSGQKLIFTSWLILFFLASFLGFASYYQGDHLAWVIRLTGGWQMLRWIKYAIAIFFSATIPVHIYLSLTENLSRLQAMVTGYEKDPPPESS